MAGYGAAGERGEADDLWLLESLPPAVLSALDAPFSVTEQQREAFARDGFYLCKQLLPPLLVQTLREAIAAHTYARNPRTLPLSERNTYDRAFIQVGGMWQHGGCAKALTFSKRLASAAAGLMGSAGALLHHDQALFKEPGGGHTPWHCDQQVSPIVERRRHCVSTSRTRGELVCTWMHAVLAVGKGRHPNHQCLGTTL